MPIRDDFFHYSGVVIGNRKITMRIKDEDNVRIDRIYRRFEEKRVEAGLQANYALAVRYAAREMAAHRCLNAQGGVTSYTEG